MESVYNGLLGLFDFDEEKHSKYFKVELSYGEKLCMECCNKGYNMDNMFNLPVICQKCNGLGKISWVKNIINK